MKIAVIATVWTPLSHADVIVSRWLKPYPGDSSNNWTAHRSQIASVFIAQSPPNDIGHAICGEHHVPIFPSIHEALTLGGEELQVDAVLLIGEHGEYPMNEFHQKLYPRKHFLDEVARTFRRCKKSVPLFNDKHLSWSFTEAKEMLALAEELHFPFYAGSSLPHCPREEVGHLQEEAEIKEALCLFAGHEEHYGYHAIEFLQSLVERRAGGEQGIARVRTLGGREIHEALESGEIPAELLQAALVSEGYANDPQLIPFILTRTEDLLAFQLEHLDGLRVTHLRLQKWVNNWTVSLRTGDGIFSAWPKVGNAQDFFSNFAALNTVVEHFFLTGQTPNSILRTHLAGGATEASLHAWSAGGQWRNTPHLHIAY